MNPIVEVVVSALIVVGALFVLVGSYGLVKLPDLMTRLHGPTKATTLGVGGCLIASMIYFPATGGALSVHELLITLFLFLTAPVTANMLAKAWMHAVSARDPKAVETRPAPELGLPATEREGYGWATFDAKPELEAVLVRAREVPHSAPKDEPRR